MVGVSWIPSLTSLVAVKTVNTTSHTTIFTKAKASKLWLAWNCKSTFITVVGANWFFRALTLPILRPKPTIISLYLIISACITQFVFDNIIWISEGARLVDVGDTATYICEISKVAAAKLIVWIRYIISIVIFWSSLILSTSTTSLVWLSTLLMEVS